MNKNSLKELLFFTLILLALFLIDVPFLKVPVAAVLVIVYGFLNRDNIRKIGLFLPQHYQLKIALSGVVTLILVVAFHFLIIPMVVKITGTAPDYSAFEAIAGNKQAFYNSLIIGWVIGGVLEEIVFRGYLLQKIMEYTPSKYSNATAVILTSLLFGYLHQYQGFTGQILTGLIGLFLAIITLVNKKSVWMSMWVHGLLNTVSTLSVYHGWVEI